jgi:hypothetical protein
VPTKSPYEFPASTESTQPTHRGPHAPALILERAQPGAPMHGTDTQFLREAPPSRTARAITEGCRAGTELPKHLASQRWLHGTRSRGPRHALLGVCLHTGSPAPRVVPVRPSRVPRFPLSGSLRFTAPIRTTPAPASVGPAPAHARRPVVRMGHRAVTAGRGGPSAGRTHCPRGRPEHATVPHRSGRCRPGAPRASGGVRARRPDRGRWG